MNENTLASASAKAATELSEIERLQCLTNDDLDRAQELLVRLGCALYGPAPASGESMPTEQVAPDGAINQILARAHNSESKTRNLLDALSHLLNKVEG